MAITVMLTTSFQVCHLSRYRRLRIGQDKFLKMVVTNSATREFEIYTIQLGGIDDESERSQGGAELK